MTYPLPPSGPQSPASGILAFLPPPTDRKAARAFRAALSAHIERMVDALDTLDGDFDLEDGGDDEDGHDREASDLAGSTSDLEGDDCDLEPNGDEETSLGSLGGTATALDGQAWAGGLNSDREEDEFRAVTL